MVNSVVYSKQNNADIRRVVYVPKYDAEVEYLQSTGTQWIDSGVTVLNTTGIEIVAQKIVANNADSFACGIRKNSRYFNVDVNHYNNNTNGILYVGFGNSQHKQVSRVHLSQFKVAVNVNNSRKVVFNDTAPSWNLPNDISVDGNIYVFASYGASSNRWIGRIYYLKIYDNTTLVRDFIPVRVGSVGYMYDKVSGQLFGNAGTGNFVLGQDVAKPIVKRYVVPSGLEEGVDYQKYDWLNGDGVLMTLPILNNTDILRVKFMSAHPTSISVFSAQPVASMQSTSTIKTNPNVTLYTATDYPMYFTARLGYADITVNFNTKRMTDNVNHTKSFDIKDFNSVPIRFAGKNKEYKEITVNNKLYLTPCQLLRPIPAKYDANGIARQQGECGMIDSVSGKFYGNVAESGSFTVENDND